MPYHCNARQFGVVRLHSVRDRFTAIVTYSIAIHHDRSDPAAVVALDRLRNSLRAGRFDAIFV